MEYATLWIVTLAIGVVTGFIVHAMMRYAQGGSMMVTIVAGMIGAMIGTFVLPVYLPLPGLTLITTQLVWSVAGAIVLSIIVELLFVGTRRGRVLTS